MQTPTHKEFGRRGYGISTYIYHKNQPNVGTVNTPLHAWYGSVDIYIQSFGLRQKKKTYLQAKLLKTPNAKGLHYNF